MKIYLVNRNADLTEGSGPMLFDKAFSTLEKAQTYAEKQAADLMRVFGIEWQYTPPREYIEFMNKPKVMSNPKWHDNKGGWGMHEIEEVEVY